jgi:prophage antirepressor-like protein
MIGGEPWFVAVDACEVLDYSNPTMATDRLEPDDLSYAEVIDSMGRRQRSRVINESGLYELIIRSEKPAARRFRRWLTKDVLPTLRKTGEYRTVPVEPGDDLDLMVGKIRELRKEHAETQRRTTMLELGQAILHDGMQGLAAKISAVAGEYDEFTALAYAKIKGLPTDRISCQRHGQRATAEMKRRGGAPRRVQDATFGMINIYPLGILDETAEQG